MRLNEQQLLEFRIELEELITEREGMIALNKQRESVSQSMAYGDDAFYEIQSKMNLLKEKLIALGEK